ncbi:hypothetical protein B0H10DRAFT_2213921 [Mycena sp. CBHHK59/15]|nr:hypothetical protein B0H10DRAFT_2213921 [Mycena sp. CBHHK59/15]
MERALAAAASASSHASTSALTIATRESAAAPASPFAQLLRQSRFATYDPLIRQTYYSPKQFVQRGYWGLKRSITQRKKNSFITITQWEARQHYVEWDNGEDQVRFVRRIEEMGVRPAQSTESSTWAKTLGPANKVWLVDSEFCPHEWDQLEEKAPSEEVALRSLGNRGSGAYGKQGFRRGPTTVIPNVDSMSPGDFKRYLAKLRTLRTAFKEHIAREGQSRDQPMSAQRAAVEPPKDATLFNLAKVPEAAYHRIFLARHTEAEYNSTNRIQPQPHRSGALMYTHPSPIDTYFHTTPKPGIVLEEYKPKGRFQQNPPPEFVASFGGVAALLSKAAAPGLEPLMREHGVSREHWPRAAAELRPLLEGGLRLHRVPHVVGHDAEGLDGVRIGLRVTAETGRPDARRGTAFGPGARAYVAAQTAEDARKEGHRISANVTNTPMQPRRASLTNPPYIPSPRPAARQPYVRPEALRAAREPSPFKAHTEDEVQSNKRTISMLDHMIKGQVPGNPARWKGDTKKDDRDF